MLLARNGNPVQLWAHKPEHVATLRAEGQNSRYLPGVAFPPGLTPVTRFQDHYAGVLLAVPLKAMRATVLTLLESRVPLRELAWACKGIEAGTHLLVHQILEELLGPAGTKAVISGPSFAREVAIGLPTAVTVASDNAVFAHSWVSRLHGNGFRAYSSTDVVGVEICGAVKNVLAIAAGVADGLECGANSRAALVTRGLAEMSRLGVAMGGLRETFTGLAGLGDLVLTCTDDQSRNRRVGIALGRGETLASAVAQLGQVAEGVATAHEVGYIARQLDIEMPITEQVIRLLAGECRAEEAVQALLARAPRREHP
jgi:glycerol-3-phosphate dehydrogenase (NAD(P)+)